MSGQNISEYHIVWLRKYLPLISFQLSESVQLNRTATARFDLMKANFMPYGIYT